MSTEKRAREGWIEVSCEGTDSEGRSFFQCDMYVEPVAGLTHVREVLDGDADLGPGIAWCLNRLNLFDLEYSLETHPFTANPKEFALWLREEANKLGIEVKP